MGFYGGLMGFYGDLMGSNGILPSGKRLTNWKIQPFNGQINYFDWAIFNSYVKLPEGITDQHLA